MEGHRTYSQEQILIRSQGPQLILLFIFFLYTHQCWATDCIECPLK